MSAWLDQHEEKFLGPGLELNKLEKDRDWYYIQMEELLQEFIDCNDWDEHKWRVAQAKLLFKEGYYED